VDDLAGLPLQDALRRLGNKYRVKLIEIESPKKKYGNKRVIRHRIIADESGECIEITYAGFPVLDDEWL